MIQPMRVGVSVGTKERAWAVSQSAEDTSPILRSKGKGSYREVVIEIEEGPRDILCRVTAPLPATFSAAQESWWQCT